jgi:ubiquinone/menaquinone biosynthesis C-methylase UbiE
MVGKEGKVYAIDILKSVLNGIESRMKLEGSSNVETLWGDLERVGGISLPDNSLDMGLLINNLFLSKQQGTMVKECVRMVKPGGTFVLVDWKPSAAGFGPDPATRVGADQAKALAADAGLQLVKEIDPGTYHYGFVYRKP